MRAEQSVYLTSVGTMAGRRLSGLSSVNGLPPAPNCSFCWHKRTFRLYTRRISTADSPSGEQKTHPVLSSRPKSRSSELGLRHSDSFVRLSTIESPKSCEVLKNKACQIMAPFLAFPV